MVGALERLRVGDGAHPLVRRLVRDCARPLATDGAVQPTILYPTLRDVSSQRHELRKRLLVSIIMLAIFFSVPID